MQGLNFNTVYTVTMTTLSSCGKPSAMVQKKCKTYNGSPPEPPALTIVTMSPPSPYSFQFTFPEFDASNGLIEAYAVIVSSVNAEGKRPSADDLLKTYDDFKSKTSNVYVAVIKNPGASTSQRSLRAATQTVNIGDGSTYRAYRNGPLSPSSSYWVGIVGFTTIIYNQDGLISPEKSLYAPTPYTSSSIDTPIDSGKCHTVVVTSKITLEFCFASFRLLLFHSLSSFTKKKLSIKLRFLLFPELYLFSKEISQHL
ncbi:hypothetical protein GDO81_029632 [Engystomops pustulosus]|uniref:PTPRJ transmembrane domain-containing protein n=1 Tax=Engystomops pustulosus TaxID=76066 RepID=A0AAV6ZU51_ENGPU|nr:hypothetical protein GDO81_029632 [Engystomops pustulosus]